MAVRTARSSAANPRRARFRSAWRRASICGSATTASCISCRSLRRPEHRPSASTLVPAARCPRRGARCRSRSPRHFTDHIPSSQNSTVTTTRSYHACLPRPRARVLACFAPTADACACAHLTNTAYECALVVAHMHMLGAACTSRSVICSARSVTGVQARTARSDYRRDLRRGSAALPGPVMTSPRSDAPARRSTSTWISRSVHAQLNAIPAFRPRNAAVRCRSSCSARTRLVQQQRKPASHQHGEPRVSSDLGVESTVLGVERDRSRHVVHDVANIDCFDLIVGLRGRWAASRSVAHPP